MPGTVQVLLEGGCSPNADNVGYKFLLTLCAEQGIGHGSGSIQNTYQVTKLLFQPGLRIPSISRELYQANFAENFEPLFGAARVNELWCYMSAQRKTWIGRPESQGSLDGPESDGSVGDRLTLIVG